MAIIRRVPYEDADGPGFGDMRRRLPSISKIGELVGWRPSLGFDETLRWVVEFQRRQGDDWVVLSCSHPFEPTEIVHSAHTAGTLHDKVPAVYAFCSLFLILENYCTILVIVAVCTDPFAIVDLGEQAE